jgi:translocation and assembly module TamB
MRSRIKDIRLNVQAQGSQVNAKLLWDSERAGKLSADLRTQLSYQQDGWTLPATAPLSGQLHANMPDMGLWALFAPPGWRIQGTLAADASISGTLQDPKWQGDIKADGLNIVSCSMAWTCATAFCAPSCKAPGWTSPNCASRAARAARRAFWAIAAI